MNEGRIPLTPVHEDDELRITRAGAGEGARLVVAFSGIGKDHEPCQPEEYIATASADGRGRALFVMDKTRSWMNTPSLAERIVAAVEAEARPGDQVCAIGNSMGGFMALLLGALTRVDDVLALTPQYSVDPSVNPAETRWRNHVDRIATYRFPTLEGRLTTATRYTVLHGGHRRERPQLIGFPRHETLTHFVRPGLAHGVGRMLKSAGVQRTLAEAVFDRRRRRVRILAAKAGFRSRRPAPAQAA